MATLKLLYNAQIGTTDTTLATGAANGTLVKSVRAVNTDTASRYWRLGHGGTTDADLLLAQQTLAPGDTYMEGEFIVLESGQTLVAKGEVASKITVSVFGVNL